MKQLLDVKVKLFHFSIVHCGCVNYICFGIRPFLPKEQYIDLIFFVTGCFLFLMGLGIYSLYKESGSMEKFSEHKLSILGSIVYILIFTGFVLRF